MKRVFAVVLAFNSQEWIAACVESLLASEYSLTVVVVDNASHDETPQILQQYADIVVLSQPENLGFGGGNNLAMTYALAHDADYIFLLNDDVVIEADTVKKLVNAAEEHPHYGLLSPVHMDGGETHFDVGFGRYLFANRTQDSRTFLEDLYAQRPLQEVYDIDFVNAAAWFLSRRCLEHCGGFDPLFFPAYGEDVDLMQRIQFHGFSTGFVPATKIYHHRERKEQRGKRSWRQQAQFDFHSLMAQIKHPQYSIWRRTLSWMLGTVAKSPRLLLRRRWRKLAILWLNSFYLLQHFPRIWRHYQLCRQSGAHWLKNEAHV